MIPKKWVELMAVLDAIRVGRGVATPCQIKELERRGYIYGIGGSMFISQDGRDALVRSAGDPSWVGPLPRHSKPGIMKKRQRYGGH